MANLSAPSKLTPLINQGEYAVTVIPARMKVMIVVCNPDTETVEVWTPGYQDVEFIADLLTDAALALTTTPQELDSELAN